MDSDGVAYKQASDFPKRSVVLAPSVSQCVMLAPSLWFSGRADRHGRVTSAYGEGILLRDFMSTYPGSTTIEDAARAEEAMRSLGLTQGHSPAGRALSFAERKLKHIKQWRLPEATMRAAMSAVYGGVQFGGARKPNKKKTRVTEDIIGSYPFTASGLLPSVSHCTIERGMRRNAVLYYIGATQSDAALFTRKGDDMTAHDPVVTGWYTPAEIDYHVSTGRLRVHTIKRTMTCTKWDRYLAPIIEYLFTAREQYPRSTPERAIVKSAMNGLIGKFASHMSPWRLADKAEESAVKKSRAYPLMKVGRLTFVNDPKLRHIYYQHTNGVWPALAYSHARVRLWQKIDDVTAQGGEVLWCHTDAIVADVPATYRATYGEGLGDWRQVK